MATGNDLKKVLFDRPVHERSTAAAYCVELDGTYQWFPVSLCTPDFHAHWMEIPEWLMIKKGLEAYQVDI